MQTNNQQTAVRRPESDSQTSEATASRSRARALSAAPILKDVLEEALLERSEQREPIVLLDERPGLLEGSDR